MITSVEEIRSCKAVVQEAKECLREQGIPFAENTPLGAMIEVPAAVRLAPHLAKEVDFFAIGTNDLIQYLLAADRGNPRVEHYYDPLHPAVLLSLEALTNVTREHAIDLCLCGEMATDPACLLALLGIGIHQFSLSAPYIPKLKELIGKIDLGEAEKLAQRILQLPESSKIRKLLDETIEQLQ